MNARPDPDSAPDTLAIDGTRLTVEDIVRVAGGTGTAVTLTPASRRAIAASRELKLSLIAAGIPIYGVTTGFGDSVGRQISPAKAAELQHNMVEFHRNGTGPATPDDVVRATLLVRANCLALGSSGVSPAVVDRLLDMIEHDILPVIPQRGSVGASGDLVPLSYVASAVVGHGTVRYRGQETDAATVFTALGKLPVVLEAKDALALLNGTSFTAAWSALALHRASRTARLAELGTALAVQALVGNRGPFEAFIHEQKPHPGQLASATAIRRLLHGSRLASSHTEIVERNESLDGRGYQELSSRIQDRYSIRCAPHIVGILRDTIEWAQRWVTTEINSANDNPLFDVARQTVHSGGNFYAGHLGQAMDSLRTAVANIADLLDRQLELVVDEKFNNGLTANLIAPVTADQHDAGLHHGFKGMQIACSSVTAEALHACMPTSVFSRSTEAHNQDKVSMAPISARSTHTVLGLVDEVIAIHLVAMGQALDLRGATRLSPRTAVAHRVLRERVPFADRDRRMDNDIAAVIELIESGVLDAQAPPPDGS